MNSTERRVPFITGLPDRTLGFVTIFSNKVLSFIQQLYIKYIK